MQKTSYFTRVNDEIPKEYDLDKWLIETIKPPENLKQAVIKYRETFDKKYKYILPCITVSSSFNGVRNLSNIKEKLPFICVDIDRMSKGRKKPYNECIDMLLVKEMFSRHPCTYYCGYSCSGDGVYVIIKLAESNKLDEYFEYFRKKLVKAGINIDSSCKDYTRLRFFSFDEEAYYNPNAKRLALPKPIEVRTDNTYVGNNTDKVDKIVSLIEQHNIDVTGHYDNEWIVIGGALWSEFGEGGRSYFHRISKMYSGYKFAETDKKFNQCKNGKTIHLGAFFNVCSNYGIRY